MRKFFFLLLAILTGFFFSCHNTKVYKSNPFSAAQYSNNAVFDLLQRQTFQYFYDGAEPVSGMARERIHADSIYPQKDAGVVTSGGSGFGIMALIVGIDRGFITREQGVAQLNKIVNFLETADRFHGVWPHWWYGETGKTKPFSKFDDGGDLVETSFLLQGLLCVRQYFKNGNSIEKQIAHRIDKLWKQVEFDWYTNGENVLFWHWSPNYNWKMDFRVHGYNECLIMYVLAAASPTHAVAAKVYHEGWAQNGKINEVNKAEGIAEKFPFRLQMKHQGDAWNGGPMFWAHYSYLGLDPRGLKDKYADYMKENITQSLINYQWCVENPLNFKGYSDSSWGLTSSYSVKGYSHHAPTIERDLGVLTPSAALSSFPYTPNQSNAALIFWYNHYKNKLLGKYGFYDAFSVTDNWFPRRYLAIDQGPIVVMMENYRSNLLWNLFMSCPEVKKGLIKLGFESPWLKK
jgi:hypothetical protein